MSDAKTPPSGWWTQMASSGAAATMLSPSPTVPTGTAPALVTPVPPSPNGPNGRDSTTGRFAPGNRGGPGNPFAAKVARLRTLLLESVSDDDLQAIVQTVVGKAKAGDLTAVKIIMDYCVGKPAPALDPDQVARDMERARMYAYDRSMGFRTV